MLLGTARAMVRQLAGTECKPYSTLPRALRHAAGEAGPPTRDLASHSPQLLCRSGRELPGRLCNARWVFGAAQGSRAMMSWCGRECVCENRLAHQYRHDVQRAVFVASGQKITVMGQRTRHPAVACALVWHAPNPPSNNRHLAPNGHLAPSTPGETFRPTKWAAGNASVRAYLAAI